MKFTWGYVRCSYLLPCIPQAVFEYCLGSKDRKSAYRNLHHAKALSLSFRADAVTATAVAGVYVAGHQNTAVTSTTAGLKYDDYCRSLQRIWPSP